MTKILIALIWILATIQFGLALKEYKYPTVIMLQIEKWSCTKIANDPDEFWNDGKRVCVQWNRI